MTDEELEALKRELDCYRARLQFYRRKADLAEFQFNREMQRRLSERLTELTDDRHQDAM